MAGGQGQEGPVTAKEGCQVADRLSAGYRLHPRGRVVPADGRADLAAWRDGAEPAEGQGRDDAGRGGGHPERTRSTADRLRPTVHYGPDRPRRGVGPPAPPN